MYVFLLVCCLNYDSSFYNKKVIDVFVKEYLININHTLPSQNLKIWKN